MALEQARIDGQWISDEEAFARMSWDGLGEEPDPAEMSEQVEYAIPGARYPDVVARESIALLIASFALSGLLLLTVQRRRPG